MPNYLIFHLVFVDVKFIVSLLTITILLLSCERENPYVSDNTFSYYVEGNEVRGSKWNDNNIAYKIGANSMRLLFVERVSAHMFSNYKWYVLDVYLTAQDTTIFNYTFQTFETDSIFYWEEYTSKSEDFSDTLYKQNGHRFVPDPNHTNDFFVESHNYEYRRLTGRFTLHLIDSSGSTSFSYVNRNLYKGEFDVSY